MGRVGGWLSKMGDPRALQMRPVTKYQRVPGGPFVIERLEDRVTVTDANGLSMVVHASAFGGYKEIEDVLLAGVDVAMGDVHIGKLFQTKHGFLRTSRVVHFVPDVSEHFPTTPRFRLYRWNNATCKNDSGQLIGPPLNPFDHSRLKIAPGVGHNLVVLYVAVNYGLHAALTY